jgi:hypothetical protein
MNPWRALIDPVAVRQEGMAAHVSERCVYAVKLLRHGPLCWREFVAVTGWPEWVASHVLQDLKNAGLAYRALGEWRLS